MNAPVPTHPRRPGRYPIFRAWADGRGKPGFFLCFAFAVGTFFSVPLLWFYAFQTVPAKRRDYSARLRFPIKNSRPKHAREIQLTEPFMQEGPGRQGLNSNPMGVRCHNSM